MKTGLQVVQVLLLIALSALVLLDRDDHSSNGTTDSSTAPLHDSAALNGIQDLQVAVGRLEEKVPADLKERLETLSIHIDDVSAQLFEFERTAQRDHMTLQSTILKRISAINIGSKKQTPKDPRELIKALATDGVDLNMTAKFVRVKGLLRTPTRPLECVAVNEGGPVHEALLLTDCKPSALRSGLIAMGAKPGQPDAARRLAPVGTPLVIYISWDGLKTPWRLQDVIKNIKTDDSMTNPQWVFSGSKWATQFRTGNEFYVPDAAHVAIALCYKFADQAVISAANPDCANELIWMPNGDLLPDAEEVEVTLTIALEIIPSMERPGVKRGSSEDGGR